jgi:outer membrane lipoprotein-sorting protein
MTKKFLCLTLALLLTGPAFAATQVDVTPYEAYLNELRSLKATFIQIDSAGEAFQGKFYLFRPGHMRIEYAITPDGKETLPLLIVADGTRFIHYDKELKETQMSTFDATPAGFFLRDKISFSGDILVKNATTQDQLTQIELAKVDTPHEGSLTLVFSENPLKLRKWLVTDGQGYQTTVTLAHSQENVTLEPTLFNPNAADPDRLIVDGPLDLRNSPAALKQ